MEVGTDIIEVARIAESIQNPGFLTRVYSDEEIEIIQNRKGRKSAETASGRFCVKEAFSKALGTGIRNFNMNEISTLNDELGKPYITLKGNAKKILGNRKTAVSISHTAEYATAVVIIYE
jgi:holo-[acyl-carrier protein] synthase